MKNNIYILTISLLSFLGCAQNDQNLIENFVESQPTFFHLRHKEWTTSEWIRKPENLKMVNETFKKFGYMNLIGNYLNDNPLILQGLYIKNTPYNLLDSLIIAFENKEIEVIYYREFWLRREKENNDSIVYEILKDIKYSYKSKLSSFELSMKANENLVNDTLFQLLKIEYAKTPLETESATIHFRKLLDLGFHESAYNLLFERKEYAEVVWDRIELKKKLKTTKNNIYPWFDDNQK